jgi:hypothetical protein
MSAVLLFLPSGHATVPNMAVDGFWTVCSLRYQCYPTNDNASLTTTHSNDVIVLFAQVKGGGNNVTTVSDREGLVWTRRAAVGNIWEYYTIAGKPLNSDKITVSWQNPDPSPDVLSFIVFGVSGANVHNPWSSKFPAVRTGWNGSSVSLLPAPGVGNFVIVSTAVNDAPPCYATTNISPFHTIGEIGAGIYGEADYLVTAIGGPRSVSFSCDAYSDPMTFLGDDIRAAGA